MVRWCTRTVVIQIDTVDIRPAGRTLGSGAMGGWWSTEEPSVGETVVLVNFKIDDDNVPRDEAIRFDGHSALKKIVEEHAPGAQMCVVAADEVPEEFRECTVVRQTSEGITVLRGVC